MAFAIRLPLVVALLLHLNYDVTGANRRSRSTGPGDECPPCECPESLVLPQSSEPESSFDPFWSDGFHRCSAGNIVSYTDLFVTMVTTYDGEDLAVIRDQKTLLSRNNDVSTDACKFQLRVVTDDDANNNPTMLYVGWVGFSFGVHTKNPEKFGRNLMIGHKEIRERGQHGIGSVVLPYHFFQTQPSGHMTQVSLYQEGEVYILNSTTCPYRIVYYKGALVDNFVFFAGSQYANRMVGLCGDADGEQNELRLLDGTLTSDISAISESFAEGAHQRVTDNDSEFDP